jgi:hypothetical protein
MTRNDFRELFIRALESAAEHAEATLKHPIPRSFLIELHGPRSVGQAMSIDEALDQIHLGNDLGPRDAWSIQANQCRNDR